MPSLFSLTEEVGELEADASPMFSEDVDGLRIEALRDAGSDTLGEPFGIPLKEDEVIVVYTVVVELLDELSAACALTVPEPPGDAKVALDIMFGDDLYTVVVIVVNEIKGEEEEAAAGFDEAACADKLLDPSCEGVTVVDVNTVEVESMVI